jgi:cation diffusion facilitator CzcD-associated flavoprotein CzcO
VSDAPAEHHRIAVIGAGFSGIGLAVRLREAGIEDFVMLERADDLGGTWRDNTYPGCRCDVPSRLYSYSFAPNPDWSEAFSGYQEIWDYLRRVAEQHGVTRHIRYRHEMTGAQWDGDRWLIETTAGPVSADYLISAGGLLADPATPSLPGIERFRGKAFHSAKWDHDHDLRGARVAVIGTGASAIQFVPEIQPLARRLHVFQRTAPWVMPRGGRAITSAEKRLFRSFAGAEKLVRGTVYTLSESLVLAFMHPRLMRVMESAGRWHLRRQVPDPALRARLEPQFTIGCKRILFSDDWYPALQAPNAELVTDGIAEVRESSIVTGDGTEHEIDTIIYGTGFHVTDTPLAELVRGRDGRTLAQAWAGSPKAFNGTAIPGFPNFFMLLGPNTGLGHTSVILMIESQVAYIVDALGHMARRRAATLEVRSDALDAYVREIDSGLAASVWNTGGCRSWYLDRTGRNAAIWPGPTFRFRQRLRAFDPAPYEFGVRRAAPAPVAA